MDITEHNVRQSGHINYIRLAVTVSISCTSCVTLCTELKETIFVYHIVSTA